MSGWKANDANYSVKTGPSAITGSNTTNGKPVHLVYNGIGAPFDAQYAANTVLVTKSRLANGNTSSGMVASKSISHTGWVHVSRQRGYIKGITVSNVNASLVYTNTYLTITDGARTVANAQLKVDANGKNATVVLNTGGVEYYTIPTVTAAGANNTTLVFTVTPGGRLGRVKTEVIVALANPSSANATAAQPWFTGT